MKRKRKKSGRLLSSDQQFNLSVKTKAFALYCENETVKSALKHFLLKIPHQPEESEHALWKELSKIVNQAMPTKEEKILDWHKDIIKIWLCTAEQCNEMLNP